MAKVSSSIFMRWVKHNLNKASREEEIKAWLNVFSFPRKRLSHIKPPIVEQIK